MKKVFLQLSSCATIAAAAEWTTMALYDETICRDRFAAAFVSPAPIAVFPLLSPPEIWGSRFYRRTLSSGETAESTKI